MGDPIPSALEQCECTELPARKYVCPKCETAVWTASGDSWRPTLFANLPPPKVTA
jgi:hypothetical protein